MLLKRLLAVALAIAGSSVLSTAQRSDPLGALVIRTARIESRIERVQSIRDIKRLQYAYGHYVELGLWNDFADLFAADAVTNYQNNVHGKDAIRRLFFDQVGQGKLGLAEGRIYPHILFEPVITLSADGRTAKGRWRILAMLGGLGGSATWYSGVYENEYVQENGIWKISLIHSEPKVTAAYTAVGWKESGAHVPLHFTAASVGSAPPEAATGSVLAGAPSLASAADRVHQLSRRAASLNDQTDVTNLLYAYGYAFDRKLWDQVAELFSADGTMELGLQGVYAGRTSIRHALDQFGPQGLREGERNDHFYLQTMVTVQPGGRTANARGVEVIMSCSPEGRNGELSEGTFENTFVKQGAAWRIQSVHFYPRMIVDAKAGWAKSAKPAPGASRQFPPDRPPTAAYEIYPKFAVAPFHFDNPVTGKPPQYPPNVALAARPADAASGLSELSDTANRKPSLAGVESDVTKVERSLARAEASDAIEDLIGAWSYYLDESPGDATGLLVRGARNDPGNIAPSGRIFVNNILQPLIEIAPDGRSAKVRARLLDLGGTPDGTGFWTAGAFDGQIVLEEGRWRFQAVHSSALWSAPYPGGWGRNP